MKRLRGWLFNLAAAVSLLLFVATLILWARSFWISDALVRLSGAGEFGAQSDRGVIGVALTNTAHRRTAYRLDHWVANFPLLSPEQPSALNLSGFGYFSNTRAIPWPTGLKDDADVIYPSTLIDRRVYCPHWFLAMFFALVPGAWIYCVARQRIMRRRNMCVVCGYDLRATPERCPECGTLAIK